MDELYNELYRKKDAAFERRYKQLFPNAQYTIWDGVFSPSDYASNPFRVLFMNREPYDSESAPYNLVHTIREQIIKDKSFWKNQTWLKKNICDILAVFSLMKDKDIVQLSNSQIKEQIYNYRESNVLFTEALLRSAYINIKKSDGKSKSSSRDLLEYAQQGLEVLEAQISFFNPSVIVGGNIVDGILEKTNIKWGSNLLTDSEYIKVFQLKIGDRIYPFIDTYHLSAILFGREKLSMSEYYIYLFKAVKSVAEQYPDYWEKRSDLPVFDQ